MSFRDSFDCTPQQYHGGLDKLWTALGYKGVQDENVFTLAANEITRLRQLIESLGYEVRGGKLVKKSLPGDL